MALAETVDAVEAESKYPDETFGDEQVTESAPELAVDAAEQVVPAETAEVVATDEPSEVGATVESDTSAGAEEPEPVAADDVAVDEEVSEVVVRQEEVEPGAAQQEVEPEVQEAVESALQAVSEAASEPAVSPSEAASETAVAEVAAAAESLVTAVESDASAGAEETEPVAADDVAVDEEVSEVVVRQEEVEPGAAQQEVEPEVQEAVKSPLQAVSEAASEPAVSPSEAASETAVAEVAAAAESLVTAVESDASAGAEETEPVAADDVQEAVQSELQASDVNGRIGEDAGSAMACAVVTNVSHNDVEVDQDGCVAFFEEYGDVVEVLGVNVIDDEALVTPKPNDTEVEDEIAATAQEIVDAVEVKAPPPHVVSAAAVTSAVIGTLLGLIDTVELEIEGTDSWNSGDINPALEDANDDPVNLASSIKPVKVDTSDSHPLTSHVQNELLEDAEQVNRKLSGILDVAVKFLASKFDAPHEADENVVDSVRDADFIELIQLPEPSPAELSAAAVSVAVVGALLDVVDAIDTDT
ncbi:unnamed protein product [Phytophthora fragariaefolia]|uniref:Unnamed protein product n=1 Tax=Phytophthora fragariaefolia TaxID=1490495 RepID=A0A9W6YKS4_9STRA|nr:unnamed protein product [Phytophthora fragariaefolia]